MSESLGKESYDNLAGLKALREQIPAHCFEPRLLRSLRYVVQDLVLAAALGYGAFLLTKEEPSAGRAALWTVYGFLQGLVMTGLWVLAHECGHDAFSLHLKTNATIGYVLHSILGVPFFSWKFSHARHHRYANHMEKDTVFVPARKAEFRQSFWTGSWLGHAEDAPLVSLFLLLAHQMLGWHMYLFFNAGAGKESLTKKDRDTSARQNHFDPGADVFTSRERDFVLLSNFGLVLTGLALWQATQVVGVYNVFLMYGIPYIWMNHWLVAITFLHHTHPDVPRFEEGTWTYQKGALATVDRDFGLIGRYLFHGIIEYHVIHHMFSRIPFYHAEEATNAIRPMLGSTYKQQTTSFIGDLWSTFKRCNYVEEDKKAPGYVYWS